MMNLLALPYTCRCNLTFINKHLNQSAIEQKYSLCSCKHFSTLLSNCIKELLGLNLNGMIFPLPSVPQGNVATGCHIVTEANFPEHICSIDSCPLNYNVSPLKLTIYKDTFCVTWNNRTKRNPTFILNPNPPTVCLLIVTVLS